jgi:hypothetical protein
MNAASKMQLLCFSNFATWYGKSQLIPFELKKVHGNVVSMRFEMDLE